MNDVINLQRRAVEGIASVIVTYRSKSYNRGTIYARYVRCDGDTYRWCETDLQRRDVRQGTVPGDQLPPDVRDAADAATSYVEWAEK